MRTCCPDIADLTACAACDAARLVGLGELRSLGEVEGYIGASVMDAVSQLAPDLASELSTLVTPAAAKAAEVIGPVVEEKLRAWTPTFAAISGGMLALSVLLGTWIARREFRRGRR